LALQCFYRYKKYCYCSKIHPFTLITINLTANYCHKKQPGVQLILTKIDCMEKILLALDAVHPNKNALEFACYLGRLTKSKITGVFLENMEPAVRPVAHQLHSMTTLDWREKENADDRKAKQEQVIERNIAMFKESCITRDVNYYVHLDRGMPLQELVEESRFADILITDAALSLHHQFTGVPSEFVRNLLKAAECPVIIAPEKYEALNELVFTYNGAASSVFAIKQFTYLFPQLCNAKTTIVQVNEEGEWNGTDKFKFKEWLNDHYTNLHFEVLKGNTDTKLFDYLFKKRNMFLVMGAYGRNGLSEFFKKNPADFLMKVVTQPIFIAHL
jgi:hypothetical protein